jgi:hypothetical protein
VIGALLDAGFHENSENAPLCSRKTSFTTADAGFFATADAGFFLRFLNEKLWASL